MSLIIIGAIMAAIGMLMIFTHTVKPIETENLAMKQLFIGLLLLSVGLLFIFYKPA